MFRLSATADGFARRVAEDVSADDEADDPVFETAFGTAGTYFANLTIAGGASLTVPAEARKPRVFPAYSH